jgi:hypothetical protein
MLRMSIPIQANTRACPRVYIRTGEILSAVRRPLMDTRPDVKKRTRQKHTQRTA